MSQKILIKILNKLCDEGWFPVWEKCFTGKYLGYCSFKDDTIIIEINSYIGGCQFNWFTYSKDSYDFNTNFYFVLCGIMKVFLPEWECLDYVEGTRSAYFFKQKKKKKDS